MQCLCGHRVSSNQSSSLFPRRLLFLLLWSFLDLSRASFWARCLFKVILNTYSRVMMYGGPGNSNAEKRVGLQFMHPILLVLRGLAGNHLLSSGLQ